MLAVPKGSKHGATLEPDQKKQIQKMIVDHYSDQLASVCTLGPPGSPTVDQWFGFEMPIRTVGEYLSRWGYTPQKPIKKHMSSARAK